MAIRPGLLLALALALPGGCATPPLAEGQVPAAETAAAAPVIEIAAPLPGAPPGLSVGIGQASPRRAVLLQDQGRRRLWRAGEGMALMTDGPRVVATAGLAEVLIGTRVVGADPLLAPEALLAGEAETLRLVDLGTAAGGPEGMRFGLAITCRLRAMAPEASPAVIEVEEYCRGPRGIGAFANRFTLRRGDGAALRTEQWIGPGLPPLVTAP
jgi:hypothetical protein